MAKPLKSVNVSTNNILLKVTVPKRIRLKRKRGAECPGDQGVRKDSLEERALPTTKNVQYLLRSMADSPRSYQIEAVGTVNQTHRFRGTSNSSWEIGLMCAEQLRHARLRYLDRQHATFTEISQAHTAI